MKISPHHKEKFNKIFYYLVKFTDQENYTSLSKFQQFGYRNLERKESEIIFWMLNEDNLKSFPFKNYKILFHKTNNYWTFPLAKMLARTKQYTKITLLLQKYLENAKQLKDNPKQAYATLSELLLRCFVQQN
jgi:hypothetical protein